MKVLQLRGLAANHSSITAWSWRYWPEEQKLLLALTSGMSLTNFHLA